MADLFDVNGVPVLVTGGSSGLGLQTVALFASRGAQVCSVATTHDAKVQDQLAQLEPEYPVQFISADLRSQEGVKRTFEEAHAFYGVPQIIINNAGVSSRERFLDVERADWDGLMDINLKAMFFVAQEGARRMIDAEVGGSIINMTSILATKAMTGTAVYSSAKAAISQMTRSMAFELAGKNIRVNAIAPGWFETRMTADFLNSGAKAYLKSVNPMRRLGEPGDIDGAMLLLGSNAGRYITGTIIAIDGGQSLAG